MHRKSSRVAHSRQGITLVFTISVLVLFLLMGTAFVIVANDYFKTAARRSQLNVYKKDSTAWLERAFYDVYRGVNLDDASSPLRGHGILEDLYGYGIKGTLGGESEFLPNSSDALVVVTIDSATLSSVRTNQPISGYLDNPDYVNGILNGRVISFISGKAKGYSTRIISHARDDKSNDLQIVVPRDSFGIVWPAVQSGDDIIINGREYSGYGAGEIADHEFNPDALAEARLVSDEDNGSIDIHASTAARPNCFGQSLQELTADDGYLSSDQSPNEPHDAPDHHNMFLSGKYGDEIIPSFHRDQLYSFQFDRTKKSLDTVTAPQIRRFSFRPVHIANQYGSTAQGPSQFSLRSGRTKSWFGRYNTDGSRESEIGKNDIHGLDVDSDLDGENDAVWIDIGIPTQTDSFGRKYQPLVAYRIIDMDGRLNINAHGSNTDITTRSAARFGMGYGVSEISLASVLGDSYIEILEQRYGKDKQPGNKKNSLTTNYSATQKLFGHPQTNRLTSLRFATACDLFASTSLGAKPGDPEAMPGIVAGDVVVDMTPYISDFSLIGGNGDNHFTPMELESLLRQNDVDAPLLGERLSCLPEDAAAQVTTHSFEIAIPAVPFSIAELLRDKIANTIAEEDDRELIYNIFTSNSFFDDVNEKVYEMKYISKDMLLGGKFDLNRPIGNGVDDDRNGVVDDSDELALELESTRIPTIPETQYGNPRFDLNNDPEINDRSAKPLMAKQLYILALLTCGDSAPANYPSGQLENGITLTPDELYRKSVAQWAANVVDFYDPDSTSTVFEYDVNPFNDPRGIKNLVDGDPTTDEMHERGVVYGAERPEILITETFAHHDRQNEDIDEEQAINGPDGDASGATIADGDTDWDSRRVPQSSFYVELFHPHRQSTTAGNPRQGYQTLPAEFSANEPPIKNPLDSNVHGVDLEIVAPDDTPVWRIAVHRGTHADKPDEHVRTIYFVDPINSKAPDPGHDCFFPEESPPTIEPFSTDRRNFANRQYLVCGTSGNVGNGVQTFGRLKSTKPGDRLTIAELNRTRAIILEPNGITIRDLQGGRVRNVLPRRRCHGNVIDQYRKGHSGRLRSRGLSLSDPDGGYPIPAGEAIGQRDGIALRTPLDTPFDAAPASGNRDKDDMQAIWTNGIKQDDQYQFRVIKLQRLANPKKAFHEFANPYVTVDVASVDLLAFNGLQNNPHNNTDAENDDSIGTRYNLEDAHTVLGSVERGEETADGENAAAARRLLFRALGRVEHKRDEGRSEVDDDHNFSFSFADSRNAANENRFETLGSRNASFDDTNQYSWLNWNNRPYSNHLELANVPALSSEGIVRHFNRSESETATIRASSDADTAFSYFFGNDRFGHLMAFGNVQRECVRQPNRFDMLLEMVEVQNRFLGSETFLRNRDDENNQVFVPASGPLIFNLHPPFHTIPNFRYPGKVNLNTVADESVWEGLVRGFGCLSYEQFNENRNSKTGPTDFGGLYTTAYGAEFVAEESTLRKGAQAGLFRSDGDGKILTDSVDSDLYGAGTDVDATPAFRNELRTRLGVAATTRSNVYAIWITIGYFEVDAYGRFGAEIGELEGEIQRHRAFYIVDRSIPVALEPGKNHNVDDAVLARTIIQ